MQGAWVWYLVGELDPTCMPQLRVRMPQLRSPPAATKTQHNQKKINIFFKNPLLKQDSLMLPALFAWWNGEIWVPSMILLFHSSADPKSS